MELSRLAGNGPLKRQLDLQTARRGLSHAYIISGPVGSGKRTLANILAQALLCTGGDALPCGRCSGCRKAAAGIHPDLIRLGADGKDITVAQVRALRADAYIRPNEAERKVYLIERAQSMNASAQNAMLKLLEEGPAYAAFLLLTDNAAALLATVRSRCEGLALAPVTTEEAERFLAHTFGDKPQSALREAALRCGGLLGHGVAALEATDSDSQATDGALTLMGHLCGGDELALHAYCVSLEKWDRDRLSTLLEEMLLLLRDALVQQSGLSPDGSAQRREMAARAAATLSSKKLLRTVSTVEGLRHACDFHVGAGHLAGWLCAALST